jgi:hypothetical protein
VRDEPLHHPVVRTRAGMHLPDEVHQADEPRPDRVQALPPARGRRRLEGEQVHVDVRVGDAARSDARKEALLPAAVLRRVRIRPVAGPPLMHMEHPEFTGHRRVAKDHSIRSPPPSAFCCFRRFSSVSP